MYSTGCSRPHLVTVLLDVVMCSSIFLRPLLDMFCWVAYLSIAPFGFLLASDAKFYCACACGGLLPY